MKLSSDSLYLLVKSLHKNEKRYFKLFANMYLGKKQSNNLLLFDLLDKMSEYDEAAVIRKMQKKLPDEAKDFVKNFPVLKKYLYDSILKSLRNYYANREGYYNDYNRLSEVNILIEKQLFHQAMRLYGQIQKELIARGDFHMLIELTYIGEKLWFCFSDEVGRKGKLLELLATRNKYIQNFQTESNYTYLLHDLSQLLEKLAPLRNEEDEQIIIDFLDKPELTDFESAHTPRSKILFYTIHLIASEWTYDYLKGYDYAQKCATLYYNPKKIDVFQFYDYAMYMNYYLFFSGILQIEEDFHAKRAELKSVFDRLEKKLTPLNKARFYASYYYGLLFMLGLQGEHEKILDCQQEIMCAVEQYGDIIESYQKQAFFFSFARSTFYLKKYSETLEWTERILSYEKENPIDSLLSMSRMLNIMVHFELENYELLRSMILSTQRYLQKREKLYQTERIIFRNLKRMIEKPDLKKVLTQFRDDLNNSFINKYELLFLGILAIAPWLDEKLETANLEKFDLTEFNIEKLKDM